MKKVSCVYGHYSYGEVRKKNGELRTGRKIRTRRVQKNMVVYHVLEPNHKPKLSVDGPKNSHQETPTDHRGIQMAEPMRS